MSNKKKNEEAAAATAPETTATTPQPNPAESDPPASEATQPNPAESDSPASKATQANAPETQPNEPKKKAKAAEIRRVRLADQDTGFFDAVTEFKVVRDQVVDLEDPIGNATQTALQSGRLLIVE